MTQLRGRIANSIIWDEMADYKFDYSSMYDIHETLTTLIQAQEMGKTILNTFYGIHMAQPREKITNWRKEICQ